MRSRLGRRGPLAAAALIAVLGASAPLAQTPAPTFALDGPMKLAMAYDGVLLVKVLDLRIDQQVSPTAFAAHASLKSLGVLSMFKKIDVTAAAEGRVQGAEARPATFNHVNLDGQFNRRVRVNWSGADVTTWTSVAYPTQGDPAPTRSQKLAAADPLTELTRIALAPIGKAPCGEDTQLFDGRQLYRLDFAVARPRALSERERRLGLTTPVRCALTFTELAGFDPKPPQKKNQGLGQPLSIEFARAGDHGPWVVAAVRGQTPLGEARIEIRDLKAR